MEKKTVARSVRVITNLLLESYHNFRSLYDLNIIILNYKYYNRLQTGYKLKPKPNFNAPTKVEQSQFLQATENDTNTLLSLLFNFTTGKKKSIKKLHMKDLISLSSLFNLKTEDCKCALLRENLEALSEEVIRSKVINSVNNNDSNDDESVVISEKSV